MYKAVTIGGIALQPGDRLEPSMELRDTHGLEKSKLPIDVCLWRPRKDDTGKIIDCLHHRCPLFSQRLGTSPQRSLAVDSLHTLFLGPVLRYVNGVLWRVLLANPWRIGGDLNTVLDLGCLQLSGELRAWQEENDIPLDRRVKTITRKMLGKSMGCTTQETCFFQRAGMEPNCKHRGGGEGGTVRSNCVEWGGWSSVKKYIRHES